MAVKRIDFPETPSGSVDAAQRAQFGVGYSGIAISTSIVQPNVFIPKVVQYTVVPKVVKG